ncbi:MAG: TetR/AcrR family transcriptional regulator [Desulfobacteraceae bacterium]|nr:TetR/AcrR family transcriptional regulator [Desulfobacteraceae bacterium]
MKRLEHKNEVRQRVISVSRELFLKKGYAKTTINEITKKAEITTGSLYHFFNGKEDILRHISQEVFNGAAAMADVMLGEEADPWQRLALEIGIQFYYMLKHKPIAELYLVAHESSEIARAIADSAQSRNQKIFQTSLPDLAAEDYYAMSLAVKGIIHSFIQELISKKQNASPALIFRAIEMALVIFQIPKDKLATTLQATHDLIQKSRLV